MIYLLSPLKEQVVSLAHSISHELFEKVPQHHHHHGEKGAHHHKEEIKTATVSHEHNFIALIQKISVGDKNSENNATAQSQTKLEKHIPSSDYEILTIVYIKRTGKQNWIYQLTPYDTTTAVPTAPPQV